MHGTRSFLALGIVATALLAIGIATAAPAGELTVTYYYMPG